MKHNSVRPFYSQQAIIRVMDMVRELNNLRTIEKKIERLRTVRRIRGATFLKQVLERPELINRDVLIDCFSRE